MKCLTQLPYYTEGPAADHHGNIYFTTLSGGVIWKTDADGSRTAWAHSDCPNGQIILPNGDHLVCDSSSGTIRRIAADGVFVRNEMEKKCAGLPVFTPNDLVCDAEGNLFFTDSVRRHGKVFRLGVDGNASVWCDGLDYPNGLALAPGGHLLYVAESYGNRIVALRTDAPGKGCETVAVLPQNASGIREGNLPDGLAVDREGNIWVAHYGMGAVQVVSPGGRRLESIPVPMPLVSNLVFVPGGLVITGGMAEPGPGAVYRLDF